MAVSATNTASFEYTAVDTDHDEAGVSIGSAAVGRLIFVFASGLVEASGEDINTMAIGGVSATRARRDQFEYVSLGFFASLEVWWAAVPTETTATISFAHDASYSNAKFSVYSVTGADQTTPVSDSEHATRSDALTNATSVSIDIVQDGAVIGLSTGVFRTTSVTAAWTFLTENLDNDLDIDGAFLGFSTASVSSASVATGQAVTSTLTGTGTDFGNERGLTAVAIRPASAADTAVSTTGTGTLTGSARAQSSTSASTTGTGTLTGAARAVASSVAFAAGTGTLTAVGQEISQSGAASTSGTGTLTAVTAVVASSVWSASGSGTLTAVTDTQGFVAAATTNTPPVGGGGGFGPGYHPGKQRFRTRKDKSHPKVITVRIGDWPEDPQIILERQEQSEREAFHRSLATRRDEVVAEHIDEDERALLEILAFAA